MKTEFIVGIDARFTNYEIFETYDTSKWATRGDGIPQAQAYQGMGLEQGFNARTSEQYQQWCKDTVSHIVIRQREGLEKDTTIRHLIPYTVIARLPKDPQFENPDLMANLDKMEIFPYQRGKGVGESRLAGNWSIGVGGHIDIQDVISSKHDSDSNLRIEDIVNVAMQRELEEEIEFIDTRDGNQYVRTFTDLVARAEISVTHYGFIRDDNDPVGRVHLGLVNIVFISHMYTPRCCEEELITGEMKPAATLLTEGKKFEGWSQILLEEIAQVGRLVPSNTEPDLRASYPELSGSDDEQAADERFALKG